MLQLNYMCKYIRWLGHGTKMARAWDTDKKTHTYRILVQKLGGKKTHCLEDVDIKA